MIKQQVVTLLALSLFATGAMAATSTVSAEVRGNYAKAKKEAATRYAEDKKLCAEETTSGTRMQCLRDAKSEYSKSLATASSDYKKASSATATSANTTAVCAECGKVTVVKVVEKKGESTPLGLIAGGVAGAVLGHQVGGGRGKDVATLAGAAGGAYAGHKIEENARSTKSWLVSVHFDNGTNQDFSFVADPGYVAGDPVKLSGNSIARR